MLHVHVCVTPPAVHQLQVHLTETLITFHVARHLDNIAAIFLICASLKFTHIQNMHIHMEIDSLVKSNGDDQGRRSFG